ncbi:MAG: hypothetical protein JXB05_36510 [Myxococcaceae bacterium]|nr:hypothetical protein [Myxococcaceae bacterium]
MSAIRLKRGVQVDRAGELLEDLPPVSDQVETPPVEEIPRLQQQRFQDGFDNLDAQQKDGIDGLGKRPLVNLSGIDNLLTTAEFKERLQETLEGTSARAQHAKQVESTYEIYFKDTEDYSVRNESGFSLSVPDAPLRAEAPAEDPLKYEAPAEAAWKDRANTVPEFQAVSDAPPEPEQVQQISAVEAALLEAQRAAEVEQQPFKPVGRSSVRG